LFSGRFDDEYIRRVHRVGLAHAQIGLEPSWYIGGYAFVLVRVVNLLLQQSKRKPSELSALASAAIKSIFLDMDIAILVYTEQLKSEHRAKLEELTEAANKTNEVTKTVAEVNAAADQTENSAKQVLDAAGELSQQGETLREEVDQFLNAIRSA